MKNTHSERLSLAKTRNIDHHAFLELLLSDEVSRRNAKSAVLRAQNSGLMPLLRLETQNELPVLTYDRQLWSDITTLRFIENNRNSIILGPVGVGKVHLATALGHIAIRRRKTVLMAHADRLFTGLRAARLGNTLDAEFHRLVRLDLLTLDDFALRPIGATTTNDFYELVLERHRTGQRFSPQTANRSSG